MVASQASEGARPTPPDGANNLVIVALHGQEIVVAEALNVLPLPARVVA